MARNRKNESAAVRFGPALKAFLLCLFLGGTGVGYVNQKNQLFRLASQYTELEHRLDKLRRDNAARAGNLDALQTPSELETRIKQMNLGLVAPQPSQIVHLVEPSRSQSPKWQMANNSR
jgi:hypothetical protein